MKYYVDKDGDIVLNAGRGAAPFFLSDLAQNVPNLKEFEEIVESGIFITMSEEAEQNSELREITKQEFKERWVESGGKVE